ncbi:recombinase family protein, partial [Photobacterium kishitanii]
MEFAYVRVSTTTQTTDSQVSDIQKSYPDIEISTDVCSGTVPATEREQLSRLLDKLRKDDVLVVWWIDRLGRDYHDSETTIRELLNRGVTIKTINQNMTFAYSGNDMQDMTTNIQLTMITAMVEVVSELVSLGHTSKNSEYGEHDGQSYFPLVFGGSSPW